MKNILKKNQIIIWVLALMLVSVGYLSYTGTKTNEITETSSIGIEEDSQTSYAGIGDAKLVNSNDVVEQNEQDAMVPNTDNNEVLENKIENESNLVENDEQVSSSVNSSEESINNIKDDTVTTNSKVSKEIEEYFSESRLSRETMYSQMIESYQKILESQTISETQKSIAQTEIQNINATKNKIMICENLIKTKGFEDLIIFVNDKSISVVVRADKLEQEQIAQIQNIITREMNAEPENIHISNK